MKEDILQFIWQHKYLLQKDLYTTKSELIQIVKTGHINRNAGPDFFNSQIRIGNKLWVGNVEIHIKSSDWLKHGHQHDAAYHNVILHVVWQHDKEILDPYQRAYPTLEIARLIPRHILNNYEKIMEAKQEIPCSNIFKPLPPIIWNNWLVRLSIERLVQKAETMQMAFDKLNGHWEELLHQQIAIVFGQKTNAAPFEVLSKITTWKLLQQYKEDLLSSQALVLGSAGFLKTELNQPFNQSLQQQFKYLAHKHNIKPLDVSIWNYGKTRPANFPSIRLFQWAECMRQQVNLFQKLLECDNYTEAKKCITLSGMQKIDVGDLHPKSKKTYIETIHLSKNLVNSLFINAIIPLLFFYGKHTQQEHLCERVFNWLQEIPAEENHIVKQWEKLNISMSKASETQAVIQLKNYYCTTNKCLACAVGNYLLKIE
jgi:hypothetical protein